MNGNLLTLIGCGFLFALLVVTIAWDAHDRRSRKSLHDFIDKYFK